MNTFFLSENEIYKVYYSNICVEELAVESLLQTPDCEIYCEDELFRKGMDCYDSDSLEEAYCYFVESVLSENHPWALNMIGRMYADGDYVDKNWARACRYFEIAAKYDVTQRKGDYLMMGSYHQYDIDEGREEGLYRDLDLAIKWYKKMIEEGDISGYSNLGCIYFEKEKLNYKKAFDCFKKSGWDDPRSLYYTGFIYEFGLSKRTNLEFAKHFYERVFEVTESKLWIDDAKKRLLEIKKNCIPVLPKGYYFGADPRVE